MRPLWERGFYRGPESGAIPVVPEAFGAPRGVFFGFSAVR
jgi:hypothetical protein